MRQQASAPAALLAALLNLPPAGPAGSSLRPVDKRQVHPVLLEPMALTAEHRDSQTSLLSTLCFLGSHQQLTRSL